jgi:hypothetical protein
LVEEVKRQPKERPTAQQLKDGERSRPGLVG